MLSLPDSAIDPAVPPLQRSAQHWGPVTELLSGLPAFTLSGAPRIGTDDEPIQTTCPG